MGLNLGLDGLAFWLADDEDWAGSMADHILGDTSQNGMFEPGPAVGAHDDKIDEFLSGYFDDLGSGVSRPNPGVGGQVLLLQFLDQSGQLLRGLRQEHALHRMRFAGPQADPPKRQMHHVQKGQVRLKMLGVSDGMVQSQLGSLREVVGNQNMLQPKSGRCGWDRIGHIILYIWYSIRYNLSVRLGGDPLALGFVHLQEEEGADKKEKCHG